MQKCYKCKTNKPWPEFSKDKSRKNGHSNLCKECRKTNKSKVFEDFEIKSSKTCTKCGIDKSINNYRKTRYSKDGHNSKCKECQSKEAKTKARHQDPKRKKYLKEHKLRKINAAKEHILNFLSTNPCVDCGQDNFLCLDFDHIEPKHKKSSICDLVKRGISLQRIIEEIKKCEVRCANCHRIKTASQFNYWKTNEIIRRS